MVLIRCATVNDLEDLIKFRTALFREMGILKERIDKETFQKACNNYFSQSISTGEFIAWVGENNGKIIALSGLVFLQKPPHPKNKTGKEAYIMNMFTLPKWRNQGIATKILKEIIIYLTEKGIKKISLHATEIGRTVYEKMGFKQVDNEMVLTL